MLSRKKKNTQKNLFSFVSYLICLSSIKDYKTLLNFLFLALCYIRMGVVSCPLFFLGYGQWVIGPESWLVAALLKKKNSPVSLRNFSSGLPISLFFPNSNGYQSNFLLLSKAV